ncbi:MAG TPA: hypothetical protein VNX01_14340 [Bacteroidia bacterium]|jgi:hypothetical protein|nr:hypothetical protein [Bacteroidia bacterium]
METIDCNTATLRMLDKNMLLVTMKEDAEVDLAAAIENHEVAIRLTKGDKYLCLVDARVYTTITDEARKYAMNPEMYKHVIAQAVVITSLATRLLANFLMPFTKRNKIVEMKLFNDYDLAYNWLQEKLAKDEMLMTSDSLRAL